MASTSMSRMIKKAASSVVPLTNRRAPQRNYTSGISTNPFKQVTSIRPHHHQFSSLAAEKKSNSDDTFLRLIDSEIKSAEKVANTLGDFPFKIEDNAGEKTKTLTREYQGEEIKVTVGEHKYIKRSKYSDEDGELEVCVYWDVIVSKESGQTLKFHIRPVSANRMTIQSLDIKNANDSYNDHFPVLEALAFRDLNNNLQRALRTYLKVRGIKPSIGKFLNDYDSMVQNRRSKQHTGWLKNLKNFIAK